MEIKSGLLRIIKKTRDNNGRLWVMASSIYSVLSSKISAKVFHKGAVLIKSSVQASADCKEIYISEGSIIDHCRFVVNGMDSKIFIGSNCILRHLHIVLSGNDAICRIDNDVTVNAYSLSHSRINVDSHSSVIIGEKSLLSNGIGIYSTDFHKIYDELGTQINSNQDVIIGKHCWIGLDTIILKGSQIADNSVLGAGSLVSGLLEETGSIYVGRPAKKIKGQITWEK